MLYSISASLYYLTISMLLERPILGNFHNQNREKSPNFKGLFDFFYNLPKNLNSCTTYLGNFALYNSKYSLY